ncbi:MAG: hypothetical protein MUF16_25655 [Burkholderiaceae bacterium]|jgi:hypothetical protein|nr:hypothetical protein [Burkholderiaceae bacterium]
MNSSTRLGLLAAAWLVAAAGTQAQPAPATSTASNADPLQPDAAVPPVVYTSPLARYRIARDVEVGSWREANDTVTRIGGWRAYARQASQPEAPVPAPAAASSPAASSHGKH